MLQFMGAYKVSKDTQMALIQAGGELFAQYGFDAVSVRDITRRAGVKVNAISYHFGGKENFIQSVIDYVMKDSRPQSVAEYPLENSHLFETKDGQRQLVRELIDQFFRQLLFEGQPLWVNVISLRAVVTLGSMKDQIISKTLYPIRDVFIQVYQRITGNEDRLSAQGWFLNIISPPIIFATNLTSLTFSETTQNINTSFYHRLQHQVTQNALFGAGLL
jgi:AcrR family transcriptional regulator